MVITGDFNTALNKEDRKSGAHNPCSMILKNLGNSLMLHDIWKIKNPGQVKYTWENPGNASIQRRIDYIFVTKDILYITEGSEITDVPISDHKAVTLKLKFSESKSGPNFWKLNNSHLEDSDFCEEIKTILMKLLGKGKN